MKLMPPLLFEMIGVEETDEKTYTIMSFYEPLGHERKAVEQSFILQYIKLSIFLPIMKALVLHTLVS